MRREKLVFYGVLEDVLVLGGAPRVAVGFHAENRGGYAHVEPVGVHRVVPQTKGRSFIHSPPALEASVRMAL